MRLEEKEQLTHQEVADSAGDEACRRTREVLGTVRPESADCGVNMSLHPVQDARAVAALRPPRDWETSTAETARDRVLHTH